MKQCYGVIIKVTFFWLHSVSLKFYRLLVFLSKLALECSLKNVTIGIYLINNSCFEV